MDVLKQKSDEIRRRILANRDLLDPVVRKVKSDEIHQRFLRLTEQYDLRSYFLFVSFRSEVETLGLINQLLGRGKIVTVPLVSVREKKMTAVRLINPEEDLVPGYYGILEPSRKIVEERKIDPASIDIVVLPGSVFDEKGGRLGYGGGFYDRFLALEIRPSALRVALAFDMQILVEVPQQPHDMPVDFIITENRIIKAPRDLMKIDNRGQ
ncbi:MAG: 5-formyltetrahydrofolate cyclo-ligase [Desulfobulbaceae bacterium]|nr:MAG: 5-formyltetrahydrofolate cyclo-ligase [Desulfobulbaceae bacterium]